MTELHAGAPSGFRKGAGFGVAFAAAAAVIIAGFWPSFYAAPFQNDPVRTVHGFLASGWLIIVVAQPWLLASGHTALHRAVGRFSMVWVTLLVISMMAAQRQMLSEPVAQGDPLPARVVIGFVNFVGIPLFIALYAWGVRSALTGKIAQHKRLMACAVLSTVPPGLVRLIAHLMHGFGPVPLLGGTGVILLILAALLLRDGIVQKKVYGGYVLTFAGLLGTVLLIPVVGHLPPYLALIRAIGYPG